ncbi:hypothetical protein MYMA111404_00505 [Mycoplasma marinum]|uniref:DUF4760 domain-containing protein n=1 Tax=Mycoplasma marinum TaxID=1937190 RepID=A0A4R0XSC7_9MOLU|nr:hypothetical protein [Mycoplasma marinum]TCG11778.1 hypothetical protein C4B24_01345 [Mycoplasma marinum]
MDLADIILWAVSLTLSLFSIIFAGWAAYSSSKANTRLRDTISAEWVVNETSKLFFDQMKEIQHNNNIALHKLERELTYKEYASYSAHTRLKIISQASQKILLKSTYANLTKKYIELKQILDKQFIEHLDLKMLKSSTKIPSSVKQILIKYHNTIAAYTKEIISSYVADSSR